MRGNSAACYLEKPRLGVKMTPENLIEFEYQRGKFKIAPQNSFWINWVVIFLRAGTTPILEKTLREWRGKWKYFMRVPINSGNRSGSCSENCGFRIAQVVGCHSENRISYSEHGISNSESCSGNTPERSQSYENGLFTPRAFFLKLGWSPGFWNLGYNGIKACQKSFRNPCP